MYQQDYILRMIERIGILIAGILGMIKKGNYKEAQESLDQAYREVLKEDAAFFNAIPLSKLSDDLIRQHNYTHGHLEILAELFYAQAELSYARGDLDSSLPCYQKALMLFKFVGEESRSFSLDRQSRILHMEKRISQLKS